VVAVNLVEAARRMERIPRPEEATAHQQLLRGCNLAVHGPRGVGKTSLLWHCADATRGGERHAVHISLMELQDGDELAAVLRDAAPPSASPREWLLLLDDVHPAIDIAPLLQWKAARHALVACAGTDRAAVMRVADALSDAAGRRLHRIALDPLPREVVRELVGQRLGDVVPELHEQVGCATGGCPLYVNLLPLALKQRLHDATDPEAAWPTALDDALAACEPAFAAAWESLSDLDRRVVRALAAGDRPLFANETLSAFGLSKSSAYRARDRLREEGFLLPGRSPGSRLADPLYARWVITARGTAKAPTTLDQPRTRVRLDAPFGEPDGSRSNARELSDDYVPVASPSVESHRGVDPARTGARVIVGRKGSGKTLYLRRIQLAGAHEPAVYADEVSTVALTTGDVEQVYSWARHTEPSAVWRLLWEKAILRAAASHLLNRPALRRYLGDDEAPLREAYAAVGGRRSIPCAIGNELRQLLLDSESLVSLKRRLSNPGWDDLEFWIAQALPAVPPLYFHLDALDEEFEHAPAAWLACQRGLLDAVMRLMRHPLLGGRLHVVVAVRDLVLSAVLASEHATRYRGSPSIATLDWDEALIRRFLAAKIERLPAEAVVEADRPRSVAAWLGHDRIHNEDGGLIDIETYLVQHTRLLPRDVIVTGNQLSALVIAAKRAGSAPSPTEIREAIDRSARLFGTESLAIVASQILAELMPGERNATGPLAGEPLEPGYGLYEYRHWLESELTDALLGAADRPLTPADLARVEQNLRERLGDGADALSALWQNGLLGVLEDRSEIYRRTGETDELALPRGRQQYIVHPVLRALLRPTWTSTTHPAKTA
jgi:hypothetical protein